MGKGSIFGLRLTNFRFVNDADCGWTVTASVGLHIFAWTDYHAVGANDFSRRVANNDYCLTYKFGYHVEAGSGSLPLVGAGQAVNGALSNGSYQGILFSD